MTWSTDVHMVLYAPNVHTGGGIVLLQSLLTAWPQSRALVAFLDERARGHLEIPRIARVNWVPPRPIARLGAEFALRNAANQSSQVLCFHGLPPLLALSAKVVVLLQNRLHFSPEDNTHLRQKTRLRLAFERQIATSCRHHVSEYIVQTSEMRRAALAWYARNGFRGTPIIRVLPFFEPLPIDDSCPGSKPEWDFVYVADGQAHKNHRTLVAAWQLLAQDGLHPTLALTLTERDRTLLHDIEVIKTNERVRIHNLGAMTRKEIMTLYTSARALIFPSTSESFGLPLIEASLVGTPILASELDYVREVCVPTQTFNPNSPLSIARAVKRFLGCAEPILKLSSAEQFWDEVIRRPGL